jgi:hypothetical protein
MGGTRGFRESEESEGVPDETETGGSRGTAGDFGVGGGEASCGELAREDIVGEALS